MLLNLLLPALLACTSPPPDGYVVLFPVGIGTLPGANGSIWSVDVVIRNNSDEPAALGLPNFGYTVPVGPHETLVSPTIPRGTFWHAFSGDSLSFHLTVSNIASQSQRSVTELPVVRERKFACGTVQLLGIPQSEGHRTAIRAYVLFDGRTEPFSLELRIYDLETDELVASRTFVVTPDPGSFPASIRAILDLRELVARDGIFRAELVAPADMRLWAFGTYVASDDVQPVLTITPQ